MVTYGLPVVYMLNIIKAENRFSLINRKSLSTEKQSRKSLSTEKREYGFM